MEGRGRDEVTSFPKHHCQQYCSHALRCQSLMLRCWREAGRRCLHDPAHIWLSGLQEREDLRFAAFHLYTALAASATGKLTTFFRAEVEQTLGRLFLHLQDPSCAVSNVRTP